MLKINEIFYSIQGESSRSGLPTVFIRTSGCHLRCTYCDTTYAYNAGELMSIEQILGEVKKHHTPYVCITGGEPLLQKEIHTLMTELCDLDYSVSLETSGDLSCKNVDSRVLKIIDIKTPDSGEPGKYNPHNLQLTEKNIEYKFVISSEKDFDWCENFVRENKLHEKGIILYSPSFKKINEKWLAKKILHESENARLQLQLHKYIWSPETQGV